MTTATEYGWVIEHRNSEPCQPQYWCGNGWLYDHMRAIRFARKIDAERVAAGFNEDDPLPNETPHRIAEHAWDAALPSSRATEGDGNV